MNNQQQTYVVKHVDGSGLQTLIGFVTCAVILRLWWTGILGDWFAIFAQPKDGNLSSATFVVVSFLAEIVSGAGIVLVMIWSGLWWLINDVLSGFRELAAARQGRKVVTEAVATGAVASNVTVQPQPQAPQPKQPLEQIVETLQRIDRNVRATHAVATEAKDKAVGLDGRMTEIDNRLTAIESAPAPKATARKPAAR